MLNKPHNPKHLGPNRTLLHGTSCGFNIEPRAIVLAALVNTTLCINPDHSTYIIHGVRQITHQPCLVCHKVHYDGLLIYT
jgi:hypothetical protein